MAPRAAAAAPAPPAELQEEYVAIDLPAGMTVDDLLAAAPPGDVEDPDAPPVTPAARRPAAPAEAQEPEPLAAPKKPLADASRRASVPLPALLKERERANRVLEDNRRLEGENRRLRGEAIQRRILEEAKIEPVTLTEQDQAILANIAATESDIGKVQIKTQQFMAAKYNTVRATEAARRTVNTEQQRLADSEETFRTRLIREKADYGYDMVGQESGIFRAFQIDPRTNLPYEPATVADIKAADNPAERAYELGLVRLREQGRIPDSEESEAEETSEEPTPPARAGSPKSAAPAPAAGARRAPAGEVAAAERRGERRGAAAVVDQAVERGRGIRHLPSAGGGPARVGVTAAYMDNLKNTDPDKWMQILEKNPELEYQYMTGDLT